MNRSPRQDDLSKTAGDLERRIGRPVIALNEIVRRLLKKSAARAGCTSTGSLLLLGAERAM